MEVRSLILGWEDDREPTVMTGPVSDEVATFLAGTAVANLAPVSDDFYRDALSVMGRTAAPAIHLIVDGDVVWAVEWAPGLILVRLSPSGLTAAAFRDPNPWFGGRTPLPEDDLDWDEDDNPLYSVIFPAWDAQFDPQRRASLGFAPASADEIVTWERAAAVFAALDAAPTGAREPTGEATRGPIDEQRAAAIAAIAAWAGTGIRLPRTPNEQAHC